MNEQNLSAIRSRFLIKVDVVTRTVLTAIGALAIASVVSHGLAELSGYDRTRLLVRMFDLDAERNLPTVFTMILLCGASALLSLISLLECQRGSRYVRRWAVLSAGFLVMALDEVLSLHELLTLPMRGVLGSDHLGVLYFTWLVPALALIVALALYFVSFLRALHTADRGRFLVSAAIYLAGAMGMEALGGALAEGDGARGALYVACTTVEEVLEMAGVAWFVRALLLYLRARFPVVCVEVRG
jgi:hypothetical protein